MFPVEKANNSRASVTTGGEVPKPISHEDGWEGLTPAGDREETEPKGFALH